ncbi:acyltransferase family protein [Chitinophaga solisilvae]|uniref:acyltransferase family protein n=1 Tax=Chitinophaga solisilvae TaxID=1233460 RepID=UPI00136DF79C|nr:acyltransferase [Chitinophaga solisilvae]
MSNQHPAAALSADIQTAPVQSGKKYLNYIHHFRGVAILYVVASHVVVDWAPDSNTARIIGVLMQNVTILFLFIAGYLFQHLSGKFEYRDYMKKKVQHVICPYLFLSAIIITARLVFNSIPEPTLRQHPDFGQWPHWEQAAYYLLRGTHMQQLWFIPMITMYYVIAPFFIYIDRHPRLYYLLIPFYIISLLVHRSDLSHTFTMAIHFLSVYLFGMFLSHYKEQYLAFAKKYWLLITVMAPLFWVLTYYAPSGIYDSVDFTQKLLFCCFFIYWLWKLDKYMPSFIHVLATLSFGIYYVHYFFVMLLRGLSNRFFHHGIPGTLLNWVICLILTTVMSVILLKLVKRIAGDKSKYFVGC